MQDEKTLLMHAVSLIRRALKFAPAGGEFEMDANAFLSHPYFLPLRWLSDDVKRDQDNVKKLAPRVLTAEMLRAHAAADVLRGHSAIPPVDPDPPQVVLRVGGASSHVGHIPGVKEGGTGSRPPLQPRVTYIWRPCSACDCLDVCVPAEVCSRGRIVGVR